MYVKFLEFVELLVVYLLEGVNILELGWIEMLLGDDVVVMIVSIELLMCEVFEVFSLCVIVWLGVGYDLVDVEVVIELGIVVMIIFGMFE